MIERTIGRLATFFFLLIVAAAVGYANYRYFYPDGFNAPPPPDMEAALAQTRFQDAKGEMHTLKEYRGKKVILAFWATWCAPCLVEMPQLATLQKAYPDELKVIMLAVEPKEDFYETIMEKEIPHAELFWDQGLRNFKAFRLRGLPTNFLIDADGTLIAKKEGVVDWESPAIVKELGLMPRTTE